jgi:hypothetical protein
MLAAKLGIPAEAALAPRCRFRERPHTPPPIGMVNPEFGNAPPE